MGLLVVYDVCFYFNSDHLTRNKKVVIENSHRERTMANDFGSRRGGWKGGGILSLFRVFTMYMCVAL